MPFGHRNLPILLLSEAQSSRPAIAAAAGGNLLLDGPGLGDWRIGGLGMGNRGIGALD